MEVVSEAIRKNLPHAIIRNKALLRFMEALQLISQGSTGLPVGIYYIISEGLAGKAVKLAHELRGKLGL